MCSLPDADYHIIGRVVITNEEVDEFDAQCICYALEDCNGRTDASLFYLGNIRGGTPCAFCQVVELEVSA